MKSRGMLFVILFVLSLYSFTAAETAPVRDSGGANLASMRLLLNSFSALGEGHIENVLRGLRIISLTEEARSGDWEKMRGILEEFGISGIDAATLWYARPNGSYYTVEKGLTGLSLRDRGYFPRLMAGEEISGDLVISKATGKRSAIVAVPVKRNGSIIGALGVSLAVEGISRRIDEKMGLPANMIFYALDQKGQTALHRITTMLFAYPSDMGSKSLSKTVSDMLDRQEGVVTYDFYGERTVVFKKSSLTGWVFAVGVITGRTGQPDIELPPILSELETEINKELKRIDQDLAGLAGKLSGKDLKSSEARIMLGDLCSSYTYAVDCAFVDRSGKMIIVEPKEYAGFEGSDISAQEQIMRLRESGKPVLSKVIKAVEGFYAVDLEHPVFSSTGEPAGSVSVLFKPEIMLSSIISPFVHGMSIDVWLMQKDGRIIYDPDEAEVGLILFEAPMYQPYPQLIALGTYIAREASGTGSYEFLDKGLTKVVKKDAYWTTVGLYGTEWRLVVIHVRTSE